MKKVGDKYYFVVDDLTVPEEIRKFGIEWALSPFSGTEPFNIIKVDWRNKTVSLLFYEGLGKYPHPYLKSSIFCDSYNVYESPKIRSYGDNPPILHRVETILLGKQTKFTRITKEEEAAGMYAKEHRHKIGYKKYWNKLCHEKGMTKSLVKE